MSRLHLYWKILGEILVGQMGGPCPQAHIHHTDFYKLCSARLCMPKNTRIAKVVSKHWVTYIFRFILFQEYLCNYNSSTIVWMGACVCMYVLKGRHGYMQECHNGGRLAYIHYHSKTAFLFQTSHQNASYFHVFPYRFSLYIEIYWNLNVLPQQIMGGVRLYVSYTL